MARIVVAEDEESLRGFLTRALSEDGHVVTAVADGAEALDAIGRGVFDLLLTDIKMPVMDGIALALSVARDYPALKIILMTGYADQRERAQGLDTLIAGLLTKPFDVADLRFAVAAALAGAGTPA